MPDEVPAKGIRVQLMLRLEVLGAVLADDLDPGLGEDGHLLERDVLRRGDDRHPGPDVRAHVFIARANLASG